MTTSVKILSNIKEKLEGRLTLSELNILNHLDEVITDADTLKDTLKTIETILHRADEGSVKFISDWNASHIPDEAKEEDLNIEYSIEWEEKDAYVESEKEVKSALEVHDWLIWMLQAKTSSLISQDYILKDLNPFNRPRVSDYEYALTNNGEEYRVSTKYVGIFNKDGFYGFNRVRSSHKDATTLKDILK